MHFQLGEQAENLIAEYDPVAVPVRVHQQAFEMTLDVVVGALEAGGIVGKRVPWPEAVAGGLVLPEMRLAGGPCGSFLEPVYAVGFLGRRIDRFVHQHNGGVLVFGGGQEFVAEFCLTGLCWGADGPGKNTCSPRWWSHFSLRNCSCVN